MPTRTVKPYRVPLLLSLTLGVAIVAVNVEREIVNIMAVFAGSIIGTFTLDLDYIVHAFFIEPEKQESLVLRDYVQHKDIKGLLNYISYHESEFEEKTLNSALFQVVLGAATIFVITSTIGLIIKAFVLSTFLNSIYRFLKAFMHDKTDDWFWSLKIDTTPLNVYLFLLVLLATFAYTLYLF